MQRHTYFFRLEKPAPIVCALRQPPQNVFGTDDGHHERSNSSVQRSHDHQSARFDELRAV